MAVSIDNPLPYSENFFSLILRLEKSCIIAIPKSVASLWGEVDARDCRQRLNSQARQRMDFGMKKKNRRHCLVNNSTRNILRKKEWGAMPNADVFVSFGKLYQFD